MFQDILISQTTRTTSTNNESFSITHVQKEIRINQAKIYEHTSHYITFEFPYQQSRQHFAEAIKSMGYDYEFDGDHYLIIYLK